MSRLLRVLLATDAFPPRCGGSGWSTYEVARGLRARGHLVFILKPERRGRNDAAATYDGFTPVLFPYDAPDVPYLRNYFKNERLTRALIPAVIRMIQQQRIDVVHAQHVLTAPAAIAAARATGVQAICTIRDYWPVCYWSDLILDPAADQLCPGCSAGRMTRCIRPRAGAAWPLALPMIPYMRANLARKRQSIAQADAIVAVSQTIASDLRERAPEIAGTRVEVIPNPVNVSALRMQAAASPPPRAGAYALYVGKLEVNKGAGKLIPAMSRAPADLPLVVVGDGALRDQIEAQARASRRDLQFTGWIERDAAVAWMAHAAFLVFPSHGPESLSRVLLEAGALGLPAAAMDTGGTRDIIADDVTGLLSQTVPDLTEDVSRLAADASLRRRLGDAARTHVSATFDAPRVIDRIEALYFDLLGQQ